MNMLSQCPLRLRSALSSARRMTTSKKLFLLLTCAAAIMFLLMWPNARDSFTPVSLVPTINADQSSNRGASIDTHILSQRVSQSCVTQTVTCTLKSPKDVGSICFCTTPLGPKQGIVQ
jgi:hypothetical protein